MSKTKTQIIIGVLLCAIIVFYPVRLVRASTNERIISMSLAMNQGEHFKEVKAARIKAEEIRKENIKLSLQPVVSEKADEVKAARKEAARIAEEIRRQQEEERKRKEEEERRRQEEARIAALIADGGDKAVYKRFAYDNVKAYGWSDYDFECLVKLWNKESGWNPNSHNRYSGAHGIPQALPASKMAAYGSDYYTNYQPQILWGLNYIASRYGSPQNAWGFFCSHNWY